MSDDPLPDYTFNPKDDDLCKIGTEEDSWEQYDPDISPLHHMGKTENHKLSPYITRTIRILYLVAIILWFIIVFWFNFFKTSLAGKMILFIPAIVFAIAFANVTGHTVKTAGQMLKGNVLSFMFLTISLLLNWFKIGDKKKVFNAMVLAVIFIMVSLLDFWVQEKDTIFVIHIKSIAQTFAIVLLIYSLYVRYSDNYNELVVKKKARKAEKQSSSNVEQNIETIGGLASVQ